MQLGDGQEIVVRVFLKSSLKILPKTFHNDSCQESSHIMWPQNQGVQVKTH